MSQTRHTTTPEHAFAAHEHLEIVQGLDRMRDLARFRGSIASPEMSAGFREVVGWIENVLEPHAAWEDAWLYAEIDARAGTPWATRVMGFEHHQIRELAAQLGREVKRLPIDHGVELGMDVRALLIGLETLVRAHIEREMRFLLPVLDEPAGRPAATSERAPVPA